MKRTKSYDEAICDFCKTKSTYHQCKRCGKDVCDDCGVEMKTQIYFTSSSDPHYCKQCHLFLSQQDDNPLFEALQKVTRLYHENVGWNKDFKDRMEMAEAAVKRLLG